MAQSLNYFLGQLSGMVMADEKVETALGLSLERVRLAQRKAAAFWAKGMELQQVVDQTRKSFRVFFRWLHAEIIKLGDEVSVKNSEVVVSFCTHFKMPRMYRTYCTTLKGGAQFAVQDVPTGNCLHRGVSLKLRPATNLHKTRTE